MNRKKILLSLVLSCVALLISAYPAFAQLVITYQCIECEKTPFGDDYKGREARVTPNGKGGYTCEFDGVTYNFWYHDPTSGIMTDDAYTTFDNSVEAQANNLFDALDGKFKSQPLNFMYMSKDKVTMTIYTSDKAHYEFKYLKREETN